MSRRPQGSGRYLGFFNGGVDSLEKHYLLTPDFDEPDPDELAVTSPPAAAESNHARS
jgi:hypothetical protein